MKKETRMDEWMHERGSAGADGARLGEDVEINCQGTEREGGRREDGGKRDRLE